MNFEKAETVLMKPAVFIQYYYFGVETTPENPSGQVLQQLRL